MVSLNAIRISLLLPHQTRSNLIRRKRYLKCSCSSQEENSDVSSSSPGGDRRRQEILAAIAMLQAEKVRVTDFLDESAKQLNKFGEDANAQLGELGKDALKDLDEAGDRLMEKMDSQMQEFEENAELRWQEIERNERILEEFERKMEKGRNENLFFKSLKEKKSEMDPEEVKKQAKLEAEKLEQIAKETAGSKVRRNIYLALMAILTLTIGNAIWGAELEGAEVEWKKVAGLGLILIGLIGQLIYEQDLSSTSFKKKDK
ncbi:hypothetical protein LUZ60_010840 [Juncus effusus]|nr:hypothetical protein LUZ60_010840 [Juncus effusus]